MAEKPKPPIDFVSKISILNRFSIPRNLANVLEISPYNMVWFIVHKTGTDRSAEFIGSRHKHQSVYTVPANIVEYLGLSKGDMVNITIKEIYTREMA